MAYSLKAILQDTIYNYNVSRALVSGSLVYGVICKYLPGVALIVQVGDWGLTGKVDIMEVHDDFNSTTGTLLGKYVRCRVLHVAFKRDQQNPEINLSIRILKAHTLENRNARRSQIFSRIPETVEVAQLYAKQNLCGYLRSPLHVSISTDGTKGTVTLSHRVHEKLKILKNGLPMIMSNGRLDLTFRPSKAIGRKRNNNGTVIEMKVGQCISGFVQRVEPFGFFMRDPKSTYRGFLHVSNPKKINICSRAFTTTSVSNSRFQRFLKRIYAYRYNRNRAWASLPG
jgi:predicted RNA-binding protein with RPS1 domain